MAYIFQCNSCFNRFDIDPGDTGFDRLCVECGYDGCEACVPDGWCEECDAAMDWEGEEEEEGY